MAGIDYRMRRTIEAVDLLKQQLREIAGEDVDAIRDTLEGEFDLPGIISAAAEESAKDIAMLAGIESLQDKLADRHRRIEARIAMRRAAMLAAMQSGELKTVETPCGTITRKAVPPRVLILDEASVPAEFWKPQDPKLDKKAVTDALKSGREVSGAMMSNGTETIQIRT